MMREKESFTLYENNSSYLTPTLIVLSTPPYHSPSENTHTHALHDVEFFPEEQHASQITEDKKYKKFKFNFRDSLFYMYAHLHTCPP